MCLNGYTRQHSGSGTKIRRTATHARAVGMAQIGFLEGHYQRNEPRTLAHEEKIGPGRSVSVSVFLPDMAYVHCKAVTNVSLPEYGISIYSNIITVTDGLTLQ